MIFLITVLSCAQITKVPPIDYSQRGPYPVGHQRALNEELTFELWYPAEQQQQSDMDVSTAFLQGEQIDLYNTLLEEATCASTRTHASQDAPALAGPFPTVLFSHCHNCTRFSSFGIAEHLASHGFIVASADHTGNTLWDTLSDTELPLSTDTLMLRVEQYNTLLDTLLEMESVDDEKIGAFGHSFGSVTTGMLAQERSEISSALGLAAPMENPLLPGVNIQELSIPLAFLLAIEDNSITEFGNELIRTNFEAASVAWLYEVPDAGHWSFSDIVGIIEDFEAGCGEGFRQSDGSEFTYIDPIQGRALAATFTTAFFSETLLNHAGALDSLEWSIESRD